MNLYREATSPELAEYALSWTGVNPQTRRLLFALAKRLEQEYQRAERHKRKTLELAKDCVANRVKAERLEDSLAGYIKVAKPHIHQAGALWPGDRHIWKCSGVCGTVQYGETPHKAYAAWRRVMERGQVGRS